MGIEFGHDTVSPDRLSAGTAMLRRSLGTFWPISLLDLPLRPWSYLARDPRPRRHPPDSMDLEHLSP